jgi:beta-N-acetylhexosaminidase
VRHPALIVMLTLLPLAACAVDASTAEQEPYPSAPTTSVSPTPEPSETVDPDAPTSWGPTEGEVAQAGDLVDAMTPAEQAAVVLMPGFWGQDAAEPGYMEDELNQRMHGFTDIEATLAERSYGGLFLRPEVIAEATQVDALTDVLHAAGDQPDDLPLLVSIDQEGGTVQRLQVGVDTIPSASYIGSTGDVAYARQVARDNGTSLADLGVTMVFAPVAGVDPDGTSALGSRTYSPDPGVAADMVVATMRGYLDVGVLPVVKHFPGLGTVLGDSHTELPVQEEPLSVLRERDLVPFRAAVEAGVPAVMTAHVSVEELAPDTPASLSPEAVDGLLREELGFEGVAITDSHGMAPIHERHGPAKGAVLALAAGNDLVLNSPRPVAAWEAVQDAVTTGELPEERLAEAATRVLALRAYQQRLAPS